MIRKAFGTHTPACSVWAGSRFLVARTRRLRPARLVPPEGAPNILLIMIETVRELSHEKTHAGFARADSHARHGGVRTRNALRRTRESAVTRGFLSKDAIAVLKDEQAFGGMESVMRLWKNLAEM